MFSCYELAGVGTNLLAGLAGARWGIKSTLLTGLSLQARGGGWLAGGGLPATPAARPGTEAARSWARRRQPALASRVAVAVIDRLPARACRARPQLVGIGMLFAWQDSWSKVEAIVYVTAAQLMCGVAKVGGPGVGRRRRAWQGRRRGDAPGAAATGHGPPQARPSSARLAALRHARPTALRHGLGKRRTRRPCWHSRSAPPGRTSPSSAARR